jgi:hypothetical protein
VSATRLLNRKKVREFAMEAAKSRAHKFTRVGSSFYITCDTNLRMFIRGYIRRLPSKGRTIQ